MHRQEQIRSGDPDPIGTPGVESALGRDRTASGELPPDMATERVASGGGSQSDQSGPGSAMKEAASQAQQKAGELAGQAQQQATSQAESQKGRAAQRLGTVAQALRQTGEQLRQQQQGPIAQYADRAAEQTDRAANYLRESDVGQLTNDVEQLARRQPALFLGGAFALGVIGARFLKSSSPQSGGSSAQDRSAPRGS